MGPVRPETQMHVVGLSEAHGEDDGNQSVGLPSGKRVTGRISKSIRGAIRI
jgi:hypothetical protein